MSVGNFIANEKNLITGAAGYLGSMICTKLVNEGFKATAVDILKYDKSSTFVFL